MKKILVLNWWDIKNPKAGGAEVYLFEVFSRIAKMGYEITLFCSEFPGSKKKETIQGINIIRNGSAWLINFRTIYWYFKNQKRFDLVADFTNKILYFTPLYIRKKPHIAFTMDVFGEMLIKEFGLVGIIFANIQKLFLKLYKNTNFIAISESTKNDLVSIGINPSNVKVIYLGTDKTKYHPGKKSRMPLIVYVGRLQKYKRVDSAIIAFKKIQNCRKGLKFIIVGSGNDLARLKQIVKKEKLESKVLFTGFVSESEKVDWYQKAWINVQPSIKEGWGLSVLEAGNSGVPSLVADVPGLKEAVINGQTGWLFEKNNFNEFSNKLKKVLSNEKMLDKAGKEALKRSRTFSWDKTAILVEGEIRNHLS